MEGISDQDRYKRGEEELSEEELSSIRKFSIECFKKFGEYPSESELKTLRAYYVGKKLMRENDDDRKRDDENTESTGRC